MYVYTQELDFKCWLSNVSKTFQKPFQKPVINRESGRLVSSSVKALMVGALRKSQQRTDCQLVHLMQDLNVSNQV